MSRIDNECIAWIQELQSPIPLVSQVTRLEVRHPRSSKMGARGGQSEWLSVPMIRGLQIVFVLITPKVIKCAPIHAACRPTLSAFLIHRSRIPAEVRDSSVR